MRIAFVISCATVAMLESASAVDISTAAQQDSWTDTYDEAGQLLAQTGAEAQINFARVASQMPGGLSQVLKEESPPPAKKSQPQNVTIIDASRSIYGSNKSDLAAQIGKYLKSDDEEEKKAVPTRGGVQSMYQMYRGLIGDNAAQTGSNGMLANMSMGKGFAQLAQQMSAAQAAASPMRQLPIGKCPQVGGPAGKSLAQTGSGSAIPGAPGYGFSKGSAYPNPTKGLAQTGSSNPMANSMMGLANRQNAPMEMAKRLAQTNAMVTAHTKQAQVMQMNHKLAAAQHATRGHMAAQISAKAHSKEKMKKDFADILYK